jgi:hypothetical protein
MHCDVAYREERLLAALAEPDVKKISGAFLGIAQRVFLRPWLEGPVSHLNPLTRCFRPIKRPRSCTYPGPLYAQLLLVDRNAVP